MPIKSLIYRFQRAPLYIVLVLSICYFSVQLVLSHITHALTLLMASYHMLCNIFALAGCIITIKHSKQNPKDTTINESNDNLNTEKSITHKNFECETSCSSIAKVQVQKGLDEKHGLSKSKRRELKLRNTFGWARIDILTMLIVCIILASLSFSLLVEALQTLVHIDHQDTMHLPIPVMILGCVGLILNGFTYLLIGGYTMHQGSFLHVTPTGSVVLDRTMSNSADLALQVDERQLSANQRSQRSNNNREQDEKLKQDLQAEGVGHIQYSIRRQGAAEMLRDVSSTIFVIVCGLIVYIAEDEEHTAKFIDPVLSIFSCVLLVSLSYRYMKESCLILLQTIPDTIDMENFESNLVKSFPQIVNYHDLHIWQLSANQYVATIHIQFQNPKLYTTTIEEVREYFRSMGINEITIQPEFLCNKMLRKSASNSSVTSSGTPSIECLMQCIAPECAEKVCCRDSRTDLREVVSTNPSGGDTNTSTATSTEHQHSHHHKKSAFNIVKKIATCTSSSVSVYSSTTDMGGDAKAVVGSQQDVSSTPIIEKPVREAIVSKSQTDVPLVGTEVELCINDEAPKKAENENENENESDSHSKTGKSEANQSLSVAIKESKDDTTGTMEAAPKK